MRHLSKEWPVTIIAIIVDVAVNMKCTLVTPIPGHHGVMAKCDFMTTIVDLGHELYRNEMIRKVDSLYPIFIMVSDDQMLHAAEGEDPCHAGGVQSAVVLQESEIADETQQDLAQNVLRSVIMSEVLMRPNERRALQRSRQRTNGY